jgi:hypothetical protein
MLLLLCQVKLLLLHQPSDVLTTAGCMMPYTTTSARLMLLPTRVVLFARASLTCNKKRGWIILKAQGASGWVSRKAWSGLC